MQHLLVILIFGINQLRNNHRSSIHVGNDNITLLPAVFELIPRNKYDIILLRHFSLAKYHKVYNIIKLFQIVCNKIYFILLQTVHKNHCLISKSLMFWELTNVIRCDSCLLRFHPIFLSRSPTDCIRFSFFLSHNAFWANIGRDNCM